MDAIVIKVWVREAGQEVHAVATTRHDLGEPGHDFRKAVSVPERRLAVHRRRHKIGAAWRRQCSGIDGLEKVLKNRNDSMRHHSRVGGSCQEVGDAGDDADVGLGSDGLQGLGEGRHLHARDNLAAGHQGTVTTIGGIHVALDVRIADQREAA